MTDIELLVSFLQHIVGSPKVIPLSVDGNSVSKAEAQSPRGFCFGGGGVLIVAHPQSVMPVPLPNS